MRQRILDVLAERSRDGEFCLIRPLLAVTEEMTRAWAKGHGFNLFPEPGFESRTLTCVSNGARPGGRTVDVAKLQKLVKDRGFLIDGGYGKIKGTTFRISNMGDETDETMGVLLRALDSSLAETPVLATGKA